jgi:flagellar biosynthesis protein FliQ
MELNEAIYMGQQGMLTVGLICGPVLISAMVIGLIVSLFQAVTQIQEMTLTFVPKIIVVILVLSFLGPWMFQQLIGYAVFCFESIPDTTK